jgi:predicted transcriptional regulator
VQRTSHKAVNRSYPSHPQTLAELSPLEQQLLHAIWARGECTLRELLEDQNLKVAYTTAMATLNRLCRKRLLSRAAVGRGLRFKARFTKEEMQRAEAVQLISRLLDSAPSVNTQLFFLVEALAAHDTGLLEALWQVTRLGLCEPF